MVLFSAVALGLAVVIRVEVAVAERFVQAADALYAADAALAVVLSELRGVPDWSLVLSGAHTSPGAQGPFGGSPLVPGGGHVAVCCGAQSAAGRLTAETAASPLPARRSVQWRPFFWSTAHALMPSSLPSRLYLVVWVADDEMDDEADTTVDGNGVIIVRAEAVAPDGLRRAVEAYIGRSAAEDGNGGHHVRVLGWREVR
jgi:hypothetical protein